MHADLVRQFRRLVEAYRSVALTTRGTPSPHEANVTNRYQRPRNKCFKVRNPLRATPVASARFGCINGTMTQGNSQRDSTDPEERGQDVLGQDDTNLADTTRAEQLSAVTGPGPAVRAHAEVQRLLAEPLRPGLYLVATPIGNLADMTLRALTVLARADVIFCEDTRHSRTLTAHFGITTHLVPYHEHNGARERPKILAQLASQRRVALISDAGTPLISDPGYKLVREAVEAGHHVESLPGPSAVLAALTSSGLPTDAFCFGGFLPVKSAARRTRALELQTVPSTLIFYEAPSRIAESLADLASVLGPRPAAVARELTKRFETIDRGPLDSLAAALRNTEPRGEYVILVGPPTATHVTDVTIEERLSSFLATMSLRDAVKAVADELGQPKTRIYDIGLKLKG